MRMILSFTVGILVGFVLGDRAGVWVQILRLLALVMALCCVALGLVYVISHRSVRRPASVQVLHERLEVVPPAREWVVNPRLPPRIIGDADQWSGPAVEDVPARLGPLYSLEDVVPRVLAGRGWVGAKELKLELESAGYGVDYRELNRVLSEMGARRRRVAKGVQYKWG